MRAGRSLLTIAVGLAGLLVLCRPIQAQVPTAKGTPSASGGEIITIPESSIEHPGDVGVRGHTNIGIAVPVGGMPQEPKTKERKTKCIGRKDKNKCQTKSRKGTDE